MSDYSDFLKKQTDPENPTDGTNPPPALPQVNPTRDSMNPALPPSLGSNFNQSVENKTNPNISDADSAKMNAYTTMLNQPDRASAMINAPLKPEDQEMLNGILTGGVSGEVGAVEGLAKAIPEGGMTASAFAKLKQMIQEGKVAANAVTPSLKNFLNNTVKEFPGSVEGFKQTMETPLSNVNQALEEGNPVLQKAKDAYNEAYDKFGPDAASKIKQVLEKQKFR